MKKKKSISNSLDELLHKIEKYLLGFFIIFALVVGALQVFFRYALNLGVPWSETVFVMSTIFAMFIAGSRAIKEELHIAVDVFALTLPKKIQFILKKICYLAFLLLCLYYFYAGYKYTKFSFDFEVVNPELGLPEWVFYAILPFAMIFFVLRLLIKIFNTKENKKK